MRQPTLPPIPLDVLNTVLAGAGLDDDLRGDLMRRFETVAKARADQPVQRHGDPAGFYTIERLAQALEGFKLLEGARVDLMVGLERVRTDGAAMMEVVRVPLAMISGFTNADEEGPQAVLELHAFASFDRFNTTNEFEVEPPDQDEPEGSEPPSSP